MAGPSIENGYGKESGSKKDGEDERDNTKIGTGVPNAVT
jgi:hypothetical protein